MCKFHRTERIYKKMAEDWLLKEISLPIKLYNDDQPMIFFFLNDLLNQRHQRKELLLPNFEKTETVAIFSDYGGESKNSKYYTYTFVFVDYSTLGNFRYGMERIRHKYKLDNPFKEISFKDRNYGPIKQCIEEFLCFSNNFVNGLVFTLLVDKKIISLSGQNDYDAVDELIKVFSREGYGKWKGSVAEKHQRIMQVIAYFCKLLIGNDKKIFWMTDHDSIVANDDKAKAAAQLLVNAISSCKNASSYKTIAYSPKPFDNDNVLYLTDILSISDLVAGSIEHYFSRKNEMNSSEIDEFAIKVLHWLSAQGVGLKKLTMHIRNDNGLRAGFVDFDFDEPLYNSKYVDVVYNLSLTNN